MSELIGYARCSTAGQDLTAQRQALGDLGVDENRIYLDHARTVRLALARCESHRTGYLRQQIARIG